MGSEEAGFDPGGAADFDGDGRPLLDPAAWFVPIITLATPLRDP